MKITALRTLALAGVAVTLLSFGTTTASAQVYVQVGTPPPPPPPHPYHQWAAPYPGAVWINGYNRWDGRRWVYVGGYYGYPPRRGAVWVAPNYRHGRYYDGYWR